MERQNEELQRLLDEECAANAALRERLQHVYKHMYTEEFHRSTFHCTEPATFPWNGQPPTSIPEVLQQLAQARSYVAHLTELEKSMMEAQQKPSDTTVVDSPPLPAQPATEMPPESPAPDGSAEPTNAPENEEEEEAQDATPEDDDVDYGDLFAEWDMEFRMFTPQPVDAADDYFNEPDSVANIVVSEGDGVNALVKAATLDKLIERMSYEHYQDAEMMNVFLTTYTTFTNAHVFLTKLIGRFEFAQTAQHTQTIRLRVCNVLKRWVNDKWDDFQSDHALLDRLLYFVHHTLTDCAFHKFSQQIASCITKKLTDSSTRKPVHHKGALPKPLISRSLVAGAIQLTDLNELELARQLTLLEFDLFRAIPSEELLSCRWSKEGAQVKAAHVLASIHHFNRVSNWVSRCVLADDTPRGRASLIQKFILVAEHLRKLNNFNGLLEVVSGLNVAAVRRLKLTWALVPARSLSSLQALEETVSDSLNFQNLRAEMHTETRPCLPYLGLYLTDLTFVDEIPSKVDGLINFAKCRKTAQIITELMEFQKYPFRLQPVPIIQYYLKNLPAQESTSLWELSLKREPRATSMMISAPSPPVSPAIGTTTPAKNASMEAPTSAPTETPAETPETAPIEAPTEIPTAVADACTEAPTEAPAAVADACTNTPPEAPAQVPSEAATEITETDTEPTTDTTAETPVETMQAAAEPE